MHFFPDHKFDYDRKAWRESPKKRRDALKTAILTKKSKIFIKAKSTVSKSCLLEHLGFMIFCILTLISVGSFVHLQRGHVSKWYIAFICPIIPHFSFILGQNYLKRMMTYLSTSKWQFLVFQKGIKSGWHNLKVLPRSYSTIPKLLVVESWNSGFRFLFDHFLS